MALETEDIAEKSCPYCAETIKAAAVKCRYCGEFLDEQEWAIRLKETQTNYLGLENRGVAAVLSTIMPGLGHILRGRIPQGLFFMALLGLAFYMSLTVPALWVVFFVFYVLNIFDAYHGFLTIAQSIVPEGVAANLAEGTPAEPRETRR